ncbi:hypothetical protein DMY53_06805 [Pseudomonas aeruginosa]|nr:hypothetical protein BHE76_10150 [Pseudomonas aeruginosa]OHP40443.1 hypothetical protein HMPREF2535_00040 [Pseudomonas sp. HMSC060F12]ARH18871.1 hypothetical protein HV96_33185 [Pseudomonas aeruginosa]OOH19085.1 hypothetical protein B0B34_05830 [Pseudomonas aeruginosa]OOH34880.1 hypothetical protein B0B29_11175 [Pseudomonas aeruginosa]
MVMFANTTEWLAMKGLIQRNYGQQSVRLKVSPHIEEEWPQQCTVVVLSFRRHCGVKMRLSVWVI